LKPEKCTGDAWDLFKRLVRTAKNGILAPHHKPSVLDGFWRGARTLLLVGCDMSKGPQTLDFSFEAASLTHFGGLFLIQRFCHKLCLRR